MDTEFARTFLAVVDAGSFIGAAERLHVTQSTVSGRIRALEQHLGCRLFERSKAGASPTEAGKRFQKHAALLVRTVEHAHHDVGLPRGFRASVVLGARIGLWDGLLVEWLAALRTTIPDVSIRAEIGFEADLMQGLIDGRIDIGVMYAPQRRPRLELRPLMNERLVLVASAASEGRDAPYIYVDWGPEFYAQHSACYPEMAGPALSVNIGWLGLRYLLDHGGSGYFPLRLVDRLLSGGTLVRVADAPEFDLPAWLICSEDRSRRLIDPMIDRLEALARESG